MSARTYSAVPGGADLTDIDPNHMTRVLNAVFGLCGIGWGYTFEPSQIELHYGDKLAMAAVRSLTFWFKLIDEDGSVQSFSIQSTGGSDNRNAAYALKGAITSAIGQAASKIGFQESVYLGKRSHRTVSGKGNGKVASGAAVIQRPAAAKADGSPKANGKAAVKPGGNPARFNEASEEARRGNGKANAALTLEQALAMKMPFATKNDATVKGKPLSHLEEHKPKLIDWLAANKAGDEIGQAAAVIIANRQPATA